MAGNEGMQALLLDASYYFKNSELSDVTIMLVEDCEAVPAETDTDEEVAEHGERPAKRQRVDDSDADGTQQGEGGAALAAAEQQDATQHAALGQAVQPSEAAASQQQQQTKPQSQEQQQERQPSQQQGAGPSAQQQQRQTNPQTQERRTLRLPGHKLLLSASSSVFKTQLSNWSAGHNDLELHVPNLEVGELLIRCMYQPQPDLAGCSQQELLHLLQLADRHDVSKAVFAASSALSSIPGEQLEWDTVMAVYSLPPACPELPAYRPLFAAVAVRLQQELGDLDQVWGSKSGKQRRQLLALPHYALLQLLQSPATRVASENTIPYTIQCWQQKHTDTPVEQLKQLAQQIRMQHCTPLYVGTVLFAYPALAHCFTQQEQLAACLLAGTGSVSPVAAAAAVSEAQRQHKLLARSRVVRKQHAWYLEKRPASALAQYEQKLTVKLQQLQRIVDRILRRDEGRRERRNIYYEAGSWQ